MLKPILTTRHQMNKLSSFKYQPVFFKSVKATDDKERQRNCHSLEETKERSCEVRPRIGSWIRTDASANTGIM